MMFYLIRRILLFLFIIFISVGCDADRDNNEIVDYNTELARGWQEYKSGNYKSAVLAFEKALGDNAPADIASDSYNGLGWAYMNISQNVNVNMTNLNIAITKFRISIEKDGNNYDAMIGLATALLIRQGSENDYKEALKMIDMAINADSTYLYRHNYKSKTDLYALKAQCHYYLGEFDNARLELDRVLSSDSDNKTALSMKKILF
ncbi:MAG: tetratricopeptide repeat protein [Candidatus Poribacteria bacterium]